MSLDRREEKLRWSILQNARILGQAHSARWVSGSKLAFIARDDHGEGVGSEETGERLITELCEWGLLEEKQDDTAETGNGERELRHRQFRMTNLAKELWLARVDPIPGVWDKRAS